MEFVEFVLLYDRPQTAGGCSDPDRAKPGGIQQPPPPVNKGGEKGKRRDARGNLHGLDITTVTTLRTMPHA